MTASTSIIQLVYGMVLLLHFMAAPASAAEVDRHWTTNGAITISVAGEIVEGDAEALRLEIRRAEIGGYSISEIQLNSVGGSLYEGASVARVIRASSLNTKVAAGDTCASACFLVFAAGLTKSVRTGARVGVHAATTDSGEETQASRAATAAMARIAALLGVPSEIIERMVSTPSTKMFWLDGGNLVSMGVVIIGGR
jgi:hypothetical protein